MDHINREIKRTVPRVQIVLWTFLVSVAVLMYGLFVRYEYSASATAPLALVDQHHISDHYAMWQDVHVMIYVGFGFLYTFLKAHAWSSVVFNWVCAAWTMLCGMLWIGFWERVFHSEFEHNMIKLNIRNIIDGDFCAGSALIAFGVLLGKVNIF